MSKIKIISNPYQKMTAFQSWNENSSQWIDIHSENNPNSGLLREEFSSGFFPFKVKRIVDIIVAEYATISKKVEVVFEGTDDEYCELESICNDACYLNQVFSSKTSMYLENARDILDDIINVFKKLYPLVAESISDMTKIRKDLDKFSDASNDIIPICVVGNYSSGKSTFINALIGYELLPSSDEPTTSKIYKISRSHFQDRASISFDYDNKNVRLKFTSDSHKFISDSNDNPLSEKLEQALVKISNKGIPMKLNTALDNINASANKMEDDAISDLIEIEAPFDDNGLWRNIRNNFVIFDTPGSNSASNVKHYHVLKRAMEDLSNGLPVFVSEYKQLDSTDNDNLYQEINNMPELDNRFTMIIVNKADSAQLNKLGHSDADRERIMSLAIPRKLYSNGVYFASSIIGLGAKNNEEFINEHIAEIYEEKKAKYSDSNSKNYKQLYRYNFMPEQIEVKYNILSEKHDNLLYANSGLYCIEQAIETFASVYSPYNKCQQSHLFLGKVIKETFEEITKAKEQREKHRDYTNIQLEKGKKELISLLRKESNEFEELFRNEYPGLMAETLEQTNSIFTYDSLKEKENDYRRAEEADKDIDDLDKKVAESWRALLNGITGNISNAASSRDVTSIRNIGVGISEGVSNIVEKSGDRKKAKDEVKSATTDELFSYVRGAFSDNVNEAQRLLDERSKAIWTENTERLKQALSQTVTNSPALTTEKSGALSDLIIKYQEVSFIDKTEVIFDKNILRHQIFGNEIKTLSNRYNSEIKVQISEIYNSFKASHASSFSEWMINLLTIVEENIVEFNPELHTQAEIIRVETARIAELELRMAKLNEYEAQVKRMMDWKEI